MLLSLFKSYCKCCGSCFIKWCVVGKKLCKEWGKIKQSVYAVNFIYWWVVYMEWHCPCHLQRIVYRLRNLKPTKVTVVKLSLFITSMYDFCSKFSICRGIYNPHVSWTVLIFVGWGTLFVFGAWLFEKYSFCVWSTDPCVGGTPLIYRLPMVQYHVPKNISWIKVVKPTARIPIQMNGCYQTPF